MYGLRIAHTSRVGARGRQVGSTEGVYYAHVRIACFVFKMSGDWAQVSCVNEALTYFLSGVR